MRFSSALSDLEGTLDAARAVSAGLAEKLRDEPADLLVVFGTAAHLVEFEGAVELLRRSVRAAVVLACSAEGVCGVGRELERQPGLSAWAATLGGALVEPVDFRSLNASEGLSSPEVLRASLLGERSEPARAMVLMADPFSTPMVKLLPALGAALPGVPVVGGMASASDRPGGNRLFNGERWTDRGAVGVMLRGDVDVQTVVSQGCSAIGRPMVITKAHRNVVQELGGVNALEAVRAMVRSLPKATQEQLRQTPLLAGLVVDEYKPRFGRGDFVMRQLVVANADAGTLAIGDPGIRVGQTVQFHLRDAQTARSDLEMLLSAQSLHGPPAGALLFTCNGRGTRMFDEPDTDAGMIRRVLGDVPMAGMFAAGEIGPLGTHNFLHGQTASILALRPVGHSASDASGDAAKVA